METKKSTHNHTIFSQILFFIRKYKANSIVLKICLCYAALFFALIMVFHLYKDKKEKFTEREAAVTQLENQLLSAMNNMDTTLRSLGSSMSQLASNGDVYSFIYSESLEESKRSRLLMTLTNTAAHNTYITSVILYNKNSNQVASSELQFTDCNNSRYAKLINDYFSHSIPLTSFESNGRSSDLFLYESHLYLASSVPFHNEHSLATIFFQVGTTNIYNELFNDHSVYIYDMYGNAVFQDSFLYTADSYDAYMEYMENETAISSSDDCFVYVKQSAVNGWYFVLFSSIPYIEASFFSIQNHIGLLNAFFIFCILLLLLLCMFITYQFPISLLGQFPAEKKQAGCKNEFMELRHHLVTMNNDHLRLQETVIEHSYGMLIQLFSNILSGKQYDNDFVQQTLHFLGDPVQIDAPYMVYAVRFEDADDLISMENLIRKMEPCISDYNEKYNCIIYGFHLGRSIVFLATFKKLSTTLHIMKSQKTFLDQLDFFRKEKNLNYHYACGRVFYSLLDSIFSYQDALEQLDIQKQVSSQPVLPANSTNESTKSVVTRSGTSDTFFSSQGKQYIQYIVSQDNGSAQILFNRITSDILQGDQGLAEKAKKSRDFLTDILQEILIHPAFKNIPLSENLVNFWDPKMEWDNEHDLKDHLENEGNTLTQKLSSAIRKQQNHYLLEARRYISQHYSDSSLSLTALAAAINVNDSYLSKLFKDNLGINFVDYLNQYRIEQSQTLLLNTNDTLEVISQSCGFNSVQNYIRVFKKYASVTPGKYRTSHHNEGGIKI